MPWSWPKDSTNDVEFVLRELRKGPRNVAVDCRKSRLLVLDEDEVGGLDRAAELMGTVMPPTFTVSTGKGRHAWFAQSADLPFGNGPGRFKEFGVDVRGRGGYVVAPGSQHQTGRRYEALDWSAPVLPVPDWVSEMLRWVPKATAVARPINASSTGTASRQVLAGILRITLDAQEGGRNAALYWSSMRLWERVRDGQLTPNAAEGMLLDAAAAINLGHTEARATIASARRAVTGG